MMQQSPWQPAFSVAPKTALPFLTRFSGKKIETHPPIQTIQPDLFAPRPENTKGLNRFAVLGDPGSGTVHQKKIAEQLIKTYENNPFASVILMGDNVYENGEPHLFEERLVKPYQKLFNEKVRFFPVLGNHDVHSNFGDQQLAYLGAPSFYSFKIGDQLECFALDTTAFTPGYEKCYTQNPSLGQKKTEVQLAWLESALAKSKAPSKMVIGHYPLYGSGDKSEKANWREKLVNDAKAAQQMRQLLEPILAKYGVELYLAAHEHHYERSKPIQGIIHILTGAAGKLKEIVNKTRAPHPRVKAIKQYHFMIFEVTDQGVTFQAINRNGKVLDSGLIPKQKRQAQLA